MKKLISLMLVLAMALSVMAGCAAEPAGPANALEVLENIWALYGDDEKFPVMGGNPEGGVMDVPANWDLTYAEGMTTFLQLTAGDLANVDEAASLIHMMNSNIFTAYVLHLNDGTKTADFAATAKDAIVSGQWLCGAPEKLVIADMGGNYLLIALGGNDAMGPFEAKLAEAYPDITPLYTEAITG